MEDDIIMNESDVDAFIKDLSQDITFDEEESLYETDEYFETHDDYEIEEA